MKIGCLCGNVLRDQTDYIPYKAYFVADQDYYGLVEEIEKQLPATLMQALGSPTGANRAQLVGQALTDAMRSHMRTIYQCSNCGRLCLDDPDSPRQLQWFKPEDNMRWKRVLASTKGEGAKAWMRNLVGHWDPSRSQGRLWYDPPPGEKGGYEEFTDRANLERRYYDLFGLLKAEGHLAGARLGIGREGEPIRDIHSWSRTR